MKLLLTKRHLLGISIFLGLTFQMHAQVGIGTDNPDASSILDIYSSDKGVLIPRMDSSTRSGISNPATGLLVYDTNTSSFWFYDGNTWQDLSSGGNGGGASPWNIQGGSTPSNDNDDDIYISGNVAIGKSLGRTGVALDVNGPLRVGNVHSSASIGANSVAFGNQTQSRGVNSFSSGLRTESSGLNSATFGNQTQASGQNSLAFGYLTRATGNNSFASGYRTRATSNNSIAFGNNTLSNKNKSAAFGLETVTPSEDSAVFGTYNVTSGNLDHQLFVIGNGTANSRQNAFTVFKDGWIGIGTITKSGSEKLHVAGTIQTAGANYPDYVFENYFDDFSEINSAYNFISLEETKEFIKNNRHLPGVTPITELERTEDGGYSFNMTELSIQSLEKIEELFLHIIEQNEKTKELNTQLDELKSEKQLLKEENEKLEKQLLDFNKRLEALENKE